MSQPDPLERAASRRARPEITDAMRANARRNPNTWLYVIDEAFDAGKQVPPYGVVGRYPVDALGEIIEEFNPNPEYRPSPKALGFPAPTSEMEALLQLVRAKHRPASDLPAAALRAPLYVYALTPQHGGVAGFYDRSGRVVVPAFTSRTMVPVEWPAVRLLTGRQLLGHLAGHPLAINPHGLVTAIIPADHLLAAARTRIDPDSPG